MGRVNERDYCALSHNGLCLVASLAWLALIYYYRWRRPYLVRIKFTHVIWVSLGILVYLGTKAPEVGLPLFRRAVLRLVFHRRSAGDWALTSHPTVAGGDGLLAGTLALAILALYPPTSEWHIPFHRAGPFITDPGAAGLRHWPSLLELPAG